MNEDYLLATLRLARLESEYIHKGNEMKECETKHQKLTHDREYLMCEIKAIKTRLDERFVCFERPKQKFKLVFED